jgi:malonyl-CoA/methylmalonyl-CoA synthetase
MNPLADALFAPLLGSERAFLKLADGRVMTGKAFLDGAARLAHHLGTLEFHPGDRLAAQVEKSPEALQLYAACVLAGVVFLPLNTAYTGGELDYFVTDSGARLLVQDAQALARDAASASREFRPVSRGPDDLAALLYTSGTTGRSKGAMLTHQNLLSNALTLREVWGFTADDVLLHALPIFHTHGLFVATNTVLAARASMIFLPKFDVGQVLDLLPNASVLMGVPTFYTRLLAEERLDRARTANVRLFISGSAPLLAETHRAFEARTGQRILERYGMTETNMNTSNPLVGERRAGTVGRPLPGVEVRLTGENGMIEVKGPNVFKGYWNMPEKTKAEFTADGYFITGDLGRFDADGYLEIVGRAKDLIISGGLNVYPKEVEEALDALPGVTESAVIGVPHPDFGEGIVAVYTGSAKPAELDGALAEHLAGFKRPKHYVRVAELPRNAMGKVQKAELRRQFAALFGNPST